MSWDVTSYDESSNCIMSIAVNTVVINSHIKCHLILLAILPECTFPFWCFASDLEIALKAICVPFSDPCASVLNFSFVDHSVSSIVLLVESEANIIPLNFSRNVEITNIIKTMTPNVTGRVTLEVLKNHIMLITILFVPTSPFNLPIIVSFAPNVPTVPIWLIIILIFDLNFISVNIAIIAITILIFYFITSIVSIIILSFIYNIIFWLVDFNFNLVFVIPHIFLFFFIFPM